MAYSMRAREAISFVVLDFHAGKNHLSAIRPFVARVALHVLVTIMCLYNINVYNNTKVLSQAYVL